jgi:hypothetical protein
VSDQRVAVKLPDSRSPQKEPRPAGVEAEVCARVAVRGGISPGLEMSGRKSSSPHFDSLRSDDQHRKAEKRRAA